MDKNTNEKPPENGIDQLLGLEPEIVDCMHQGEISKQSVSADKKAKEWMRYFGIERDVTVKYNSGFCLFQLISENSKNINHELLNVDSMLELMNKSNNIYTENEYNLVKNLHTIPSVGKAMKQVQEDRKARGLRFLPNTETNYLAFGIFGIKSVRPSGQNYIAIDKRNLRKSQSNWLKFSIFDEKSVLIVENQRSPTPKRVIDFMRMNPLGHCCSKRSFNNLYILNFIESTKSEDRSVEVNLFTLEPLKYWTYEHGSHFCQTGDDKHVVKRPRMQ